VLLKVLRGGGAPVVASGSSPPAVTFESLLADRYGLAATLTGTLSTVTVSGPVASGELVLGGATVQPTDLAGRLLTVTEPGRSISTHRIVRAAAAGVATNQPGNSFSIVFDVAGGLRAFSPSADPCRVIINGREFAGEPPDNESWDGFDAANPFLARVGPGATIVSSTVTRPSYLAAGATLDADNDGDGVLDGRFLDVGLPSTVDAHGNTVQLQASILIVDLDGRFNVNAHDGLPRTIYTGSNFDKWTTAVATGSVPLGSGYGPAEIDGGKMFPTATLNSGLAENPLLFTVVGGKSARQVGLRPTNSRFTAGQSTPRLEALEGRYGEKAPTYWPASSPLPSDVALADADFRFARPGIAMTDDEASRTNDRRAQPQQPQGVNYGIPPLWWTGQATFNWGDDGAGSYPLPGASSTRPPTCTAGCGPSRSPPAVRPSSRPSPSPSPNGPRPATCFARPAMIPTRSGSTRAAGPEASSTIRGPTAPSPPPCRLRTTRLPSPNWRRSCGPTMSMPTGCRRGSSPCSGRSPRRPGSR